MAASKTQGGMSFRELQSFSKALLVKQCWRLLQNPHSLVAQIMKAKYYLHGSPLEVPLCKKPSFVWRSITSARELLKDELVWRIGSGENVNIWSDKWLPTPTTYAIQSSRHTFSEYAKVVELIDPDTKGWNVPLLKNIFWMEEAMLISQIPLSRYRQPDVLYWRGTTTSNFTVKSAYHLEKEHIERHKVGVSTCYEPSDFWKLLWDMKVQKSIKMFLWKACKDIFPAKVNLQKRGIDLDPLCIFCKMERETIYHILWECSSSTDVWGACGTTIQKSVVNGNTFEKVFVYMMSRCTKVELDIFAVIARKIWFRRNTVVHGGSSFIQTS